MPAVSEQKRWRQGRLAAMLGPARAAANKARPASRCFGTFWRECRGVAMIEFAVTTPLVVAMLLPLVDVGMGFYSKTQLMTAAQAGAQYAWLQGFNSANIQSVVQSATGLGSTALPLTDITVSLSCKCVDATTNQFSTNPASISAASASVCSGEPSTYCNVGNNVPGQPAAYVTVTITPSTACSMSSSDAVCYKPLFTYGIFQGAVDLSVSSTVRISS
jgi:Flp pilus assembly protein TadG